jgi:hypothetical protein
MPEVSAVQTPVIPPPHAVNGSTSLADIAAELSEKRRKAAESASPDVPETPDSPVQGDPDSDNRQINEPPPDDAPKSESQDEEPAPVDPPRSWTKDEKQRFKTLPRETQEYLVAREGERDRDIGRRQTELDEKTKAITAKEQQTEEVRKQYETALPLLLNSLQSTLAGEFGDIRTMADVQKMSVEDWPRYIRWDAHQKQVAAVQQEITAAVQRQSTEEQAKFAKYAEDEDKLFAEHVPDFNDKDKAEKLQKGARDALIDLGFKPEELARAWNGQDKLSLRDHRVQLLIKAAVEQRVLAAEKANGVKKAATKGLPPVQRPGVAAAPSGGSEATIKSLETQLSKATGTRAIKIAAQLRDARRSAASG